MDSKHGKMMISSFFALFIMIFLAACTDKRSEDETYSGDYNSDDLITVVQGGDYPDIQFPKNQLIIQIAAGITRDDVLAMIDEMNIKLIGQIPTVGLYQLSVNSNTQAELDQIKEQLLSRTEVTYAGYNIICHQTDDVGRCPVQPDLRISELECDTIPNNQTQYFTALEILQGLRDDIQMDPVTIGILEDGYNRNSGQFDDITIENVSERHADGRQVELDATDLHGNAVAGIICADNDGTVINGLASTLLEDKLRVIMARPVRYSVFQLNSALCGLAFESDIVNFNYTAGLNPDYSIIPEFWIPLRNVMSNFGWVLFVISAPNMTGRLDSLNDLPPGDVILENTIVVTSWSGANPSVRTNRSAYGDGVDMAAPGENINVLNEMGGSHLRSGTSYATPQVTSAAALLQSVGGRSLTPGEIKQLMLNATWSAATEPEGGIQLNFANPLVDLLWQMYSDQSWAQYLMDWNDVGMHDTPAMIEMQICQDTNVTVEEFGEFALDPESPCSAEIPFFMSPNGSTWSVDLTGYSSGSDLLALHIQTNEPKEFLLNEDFPIDGSSSSLWVNVSICSDNNQNCHCDCTESGGGYYYNSCATSGTLQLSRCSIIERTPQNEPKYLSMDLSFEGMLNGELMDYDSIPPSAAEFAVHFKGWIQSVDAVPLPVLATFDEHVEDICSE